MADVIEFQDNMTDAGTGTANLNTRNLQTPSGDTWRNEHSPEIINIDKDNDYAIAPDTADNAWVGYAPDTTNYSGDRQYAQAEVYITDGTNRGNARAGVECRFDRTGADKGIVALLRGSPSAGNKTIQLLEQTNSSSLTQFGTVDFAWLDNTYYKIRLEVKDLTGSDIECKVFIDNVLKLTATLVSANLYNTQGKPKLVGRLATNWNSSDHLRWRNFEAGIIGDDHEFVGSASLPFGGTASIGGGLTEFVGSANAPFGGAGAMLAEYQFAGSAAATFGGTAAMIQDFAFKWSIDNLEARTDYGFPTVYVEINNTTMPTGAFPTGDFFERRLTEMPRLVESELDTRFGITGFQRVTLTADNSDGLFGSIEGTLQGAFVRMFFVNESGTVYKEFKGQVVDWTLSHTVKINVEDVDALAFTQDLPKRTLNDLVEAEKTADAGFAANVVANDLGKPIPIIFGRAVKVPLLYVKADETNREYDYIIGEGAGLNSKFFQEVFTVYRDDRALDSIEGTMAASTSTTIDLETADRRPDSWYRYWWVEMLTGNAAGEITDVTAYDSTTNKCTVTTWETTPTSGTYRLREWRPYSGSQASPYDDYAFIRFKKRMGESGRTDPLYADVNGLQDEVNVVDTIESVLSNSTWGFGIGVDTSSFAAASALSEITAMKCEGAVISTTGAGDLLRELLGFRDMTLSKADNIEIAVDQAKTSTLNIGLGDETGYHNVLEASPAIEYIHPDEKVKSLKVRYRRNLKENDTYLHEFERSSSTNGIDTTINLPFIYEHGTADRVLDYKRKRFAAAVKSLGIDVGQDAVNAGRGKLATIDIPSLAVSSDWEITGINVTPAGSQSLSLVPYSALPYTYVPFTSEGGTLPVDELFDIPPDFSNTPPDPVSGLTVVGSVRLSEQSDRSGVLDISWTPPNDGNYQHAEVFIKENGEPVGSYKSYGMFETGTTIDSLKANEAYDVLVVSISPDGNKGLGTEKTNTTTGSATSAPGTPSTPTANRFGRSWRFEISPNPAGDNISHYVWEIATSGGTLQKTIDRAGTQVTWNIGGTSIDSYKARVKAVNIYGQESGFSSYSSAISTELWQSGHYNTGSVNNNAIGGSSVDENKRIVVFNDLHTFPLVNLGPDTGKATALYTKTHSKGREMVVTLRAQHNIASTTGVIASSYVDLNTTSQIRTRYEALNVNSTTLFNLSVTHEIWYW
jgi:hypothetical protein